MYFLTDRFGAIVLMVCSLWCLGTWPLFFNIAERRGRLPQHTYIDYAISTFLFAVAFALILGQIGENSPSLPNFVPQLVQDNGPAAVIAMLGGLSLGVGNIAMQYSLVFLGVSLTEVISASLAVIIGTTMNYFLDNCLNKAEILFPGVGCFIIAVILGSFLHASNRTDIQAQLCTNPYSQFQTSLQYKLESSPLLHDQHCSEVHWEHGLQGPDCNRAELLVHLEDSRAVKASGSTVFRGLGLAFLAGCCYGLFSPLFNIATNDQFQLLKPGVAHLSVYTAFFYFSLGLLLCAIVVNIYFLYYPILGLPKSSLSAYFSDWKGRELAVMAGLVCGLGNGFQFMGGQAAGYAASDSVQALPLVGTFWGIVLFREYRNASRRTYVLLAAMLTMFVVAVTLLIMSARERR